MIVERDSYVSPDLMVFLGERASGLSALDWIRVVPDLIAEVLSPSTSRYDRLDKRRLYAALGVGQYWMVDPEARTLEEHVLDKAGQYRVRVVSAPDVFRPVLFPDLVIDLDRLLAQPHRSRSILLDLSRIISIKLARPGPAARP